MSKHGSFTGVPQAEWCKGENGPDRDMKLLEEFKYTDPNGREWVAPKGSVVDGASIPRPLWTAVGSPYTGDYRRASILHDVACHDPSISRKDADRMFYYACRAGGCSKAQSALLYAGVRLGAWAKSVVGVFVADETYRLPCKHHEYEKELIDKYTEIVEFVKGLEGEPSFEDIDALVESKLD